MGVPLNDLDPLMRNVPEAGELGKGPTFQDLGAYRFREVLSDGRPLQYLVINKRSDVLVVSFHGALDRKKFSLPRFERVATILERDVNIMAFADPGLHTPDPRLAQRLELTWFTGPPQLDYFPILAARIDVAARALGASRILITGSSGGGFAALQVAPLIENSTALAFNPQTEVSRYVLPSGSVWAQRNYLDALAPQLWPPTLADLGNVDWTLPLGDRLSAIRRHRMRPPSRTIYVTNKNDWHHEQHFTPYVREVDAAGYGETLFTVVQNGKTGHQAPDRDNFLKQLDFALRTTP